MAGVFKKWWEGRYIMHWLAEGKCIGLVTPGYNAWMVLCRHYWEEYEFFKPQGHPTPAIFYHKNNT